MSDEPRYQSRALTVTQWEIEKSNLLAAGWEYRPGEAGIVYARKHVDGPANQESKGWMKV